jgi:lambda repressor-like predicted transcriptional regulator
MTNAKLKKQFTNIIENHFDRELWHSWPERTYEESIEPFLEDLIRIVRCFKRGQNFKQYKYCADFAIGEPTISGSLIGRRIKELRLKKGWSLTQFAKKTKLNIEYLFNIERGEPILRIWALEQILGVLKVKSSAVLDF